MPNYKAERLARATEVLDSIAADYPIRKPHAKPQKAISGTAPTISKPGVRFCLPDELESTNNFDKRY